jgi:hypothetical protein
MYVQGRGRTAHRGVTVRRVAQMPVGSCVEAWVARSGRVPRGGLVQVPRGGLGQVPRGRGRHGCDEQGDGWGRGRVGRPEGPRAASASGHAPRGGECAVGHAEAALALAMVRGWRRAVLRAERIARAWLLQKQVRRGGRVRGLEHVVTKSGRAGDGRKSSRAVPGRIRRGRWATREQVVIAGRMVPRGGKGSSRTWSKVHSGCPGCKLMSLKKFIVVK